MELHQHHLKAKTEQYNAALLIQTHIRIFLGKRQVAHAAQKQLIHYVPLDREEYWYNPKTRIIKYKKPKILLKFDSIQIKLPPKGCEYIVYCFYCTTKHASLNCIECEESYCQTCFMNIHCKGHRRDHR